MLHVVQVKFASFTIRLFTFGLCLALLGATQLLASEIKVGSSYKEVVRQLGKPDGVLGARSKTVLTYGKAKIKLQDDVVTWISPELDKLLADRAQMKDSVETLRERGYVNFRGKWMTPAQSKAIISAEIAEQEKQAPQSAGAGTVSRGWLTDFADAQAEAERSNRKILLNFTGSDWCGWCHRLDAEVFSQASFLDFAQENYVLVTVDFPRKTKLSSSLKAQNESLAQKYGIRGFPTVIVINPDGRVHAKSGYVKGGPSAFIGSLQ